MHPIDRFTKDETSAKVWWPFAMLVVVLLALTVPGQRRADAGIREDATDAASALLLDVLTPQLAEADLSAPLDDASAEPIVGSVSAAIPDASVRAVRLWSTDGTLLLSTVRSDPTGSQEALNDAQLSAAALVAGKPVTIDNDSLLTGEETAPRFHVYVGLGTSPAVIGEVAYSTDGLESTVDRTWLQYRLVLGAAALVLLSLAGLSMREPVARIGAGVAFYDASVPAGMAMIEAEEATMLRRAGQHVRERLASLEQRLHESEEIRLGLEGDLQRALSLKATGVRAMGAPAARPAPPVVVPESAPVVQQAAEPAPADAPAAAPETSPRRPPKGKHAAKRPADKKPAAKKKTTPAKPGPVQPVPEEIVVTEQVVEVPAAPEPVVPEPVAAFEDLSAHEPEVVVLPAEPAATHAADNDSFVYLPDSATVRPSRMDPGADADEEALAVLERLVEPVGVRVGNEEDASVMRARLARTAALKKPGSKERRDERLHRDDDAPERPKP